MTTVLVNNVVSQRSRPRPLASFITMASPPDQYNFVEQPSQDFFCPITFELLLDAHQTMCCKGNHLSEKAVERHQREGKPCPICRQGLKTVPDYYFQRKVRELKLRCPNKRLGCQWVGELGNLEDHLKERSVVGDCQCVEVACPNSCGGRVQRRLLAEHKSNICPKRPFTCKYCAYEATYHEITEEHWAVCRKYPLQCPNKCGENAIERQDLKRHLEETCPLMVIECEFGFAGCEKEMERRLMQAHLDESVKIHLSMLREKFEEQEKKLNKQEEKLNKQEEKLFEQKETISNLQQEQSTQTQTLHTQLQEKEKRILNLLQRVESLERTKGQAPVLKLHSPELTNEQYVQNDHSSYVANIHLLAAIPRSQSLPPAFIPPPVFTTTDFEKHKRDDDRWYSPPFYSHIGGYKMCICVTANGYGSGTGTHVGVAVHMMRGEYDDHLCWPFREDITVQLLNQRRDGGLVEVTIVFDDTASDEVAGRVVGKERASSGRGFSKFITHTALDYDAAKNTEYLKNDCLKFRVTNVIVKSTK